MALIVSHRKLTGSLYGKDAMQPTIFHVDLKEIVFSAAHQIPLGLTKAIKILNVAVQGEDPKISAG
jgi:hypothetical protein